MLYAGEKKDRCTNNGTNIIVRAPITRALDVAADWGDADDDECFRKLLHTFLVGTSRDYLHDGMPPWVRVIQNPPRALLE